MALPFQASLTRYNACVSGVHVVLLQEMYTGLQTVQALCLATRTKGLLTLSPTKLPPYHGQL